jgi:hypothetical protein
MIDVAATALVAGASALLALDVRSALRRPAPQLPSGDAQRPLGGRPWPIE